jgi:hypothetical protein
VNLVSTTRSFGEFEGRLVNSLRDVLRNFFGEEGARLIASYVEKYADMSIEALCGKPELLSEMLHKIAGKSSKVVELHVLKNLSQALHIELPEGETGSFAEKVSRLKAMGKSSGIQ